MLKTIGFLKSALVALALVGVVFPQALILADQETSPKPKIKIVDAKTILDVTLAKDGTFAGRTVDHGGNPIEGAKIVIKRGKTQIGESVSDDKGNFSIKGMKTGVFQVSSGETAGNYRLWSEKAAPPSARPQALLVLGENGTRGQCGSCDPCDPSGSIILLSAVGLGLVGLGLGVTGLVVASNAERKASAAEAKANAAFHSP